MGEVSKKGYGGYLEGCPSRPKNTGRSEVVVQGNDEKARESNPKGRKESQITKRRRSFGYGYGGIHTRGRGPWVRGDGRGVVKTAREPQLDVKTIEEEENLIVKKQPQRDLGVGICSPLQRYGEWAVRRKGGRRQVRREGGGGRTRKRNRVEKLSKVTNSRWGLAFFGLVGAELLREDEVEVGNRRGGQVGGPGGGEGGCGR